MYFIYYLEVLNIDMCLCELYGYLCEWKAHRLEVVIFISCWLFQELHDVLKVQGYIVNPRH